MLQELYLVSIDEPEGDHGVVADVGMMKTVQAVCELFFTPAFLKMKGGHYIDLITGLLYFWVHGSCSSNWYLSSCPEAATSFHGDS